MAECTHTYLELYHTCMQCLTLCAFTHFWGASADVIINWSAPVRYVTTQEKFLKNRPVPE